MNSSNTLYSSNNLYSTFTSPEQYQGYSMNQFDSLLDFLPKVSYPSPCESPLANDVSLMTPNNNTPQPVFGVAGGFLNDSMLMVPPIDQFKYYTNFEKLVYEPKMLDIDYLDKFIAQHEAALNMPELEEDENQMPEEEEEEEEEEEAWSHCSSPKHSPTKKDEEEIIILQDRKTNRIIKKSPGRRGRTKGTKNKPKVSEESKPKPKRGPLEGVLYVCQHDGCGRSFTRPYNLTSHMRTHTSERPYACSHCGRRFARQHDRNRHEKLHWGIRPYACHHCHKAFARMDALNRHLRMENGCSVMQV